MTDAVYRIVEHDGGWAYKLGDVFSETFRDRQSAEAAAKRVAEEQRLSGDDEAISWEDEAGRWHDETVRGNDRPHAYVAGDEPREAEEGASTQGGFGRRAKDFAFGTYDRADQQTRRGTHLARNGIRAEPLLMALLALGCGFALGMAVQKRTR